MDSLLMMELKKIPQIWDMLSFQGLWHLRVNFFWKYQICDGLYSSLLCAIKVKRISKFITYPKGCFSWPILNKGVQKG
jgi:hypothetical protein